MTPRRNGLRLTGTFWSAALQFKTEVSKQSGDASLIPCPWPRSVTATGAVSRPRGPRTAQ